jgi:hypothetical protein
MQGISAMSNIFMIAALTIFLVAPKSEFGLDSRVQAGPCDPTVSQCL